MVNNSGCIMIDLSMKIDAFSVFSVKFTEKSQFNYSRKNCASSFILNTDEIMMYGFAQAIRKILRKVASYHIRTCTAPSVLGNTEV